MPSAMRSEKECTASAISAWDLASMPTKSCSIERRILTHTLTMVNGVRLGYVLLREQSFQSLQKKSLSNQSPVTRQVTGGGGNGCVGLESRQGEVQAGRRQGGLFHPHGWPLIPSPRTRQSAFSVGPSWPP